MTTTFHSMYNDIIHLVNQMNDINKNKYKTLYHFMEYFCEHVNELSEHFDNKLLKMLVKFADYMKHDETLHDRFNLFFEKLEPFSSKCKEDIISDEFSEVNTSDAPYGYYLASFKKPIHHYEMKRLRKYLSYVIMKRWPRDDDIDVTNINTEQDFEIFYENLKRFG